MNILTTLNEWRDWRNSFTDQSIGFVPTMGHLHDGHLSLVQASQQHNAMTVVSIFVNPTQFNESSDFEKYPRTVEEDLRQLKAVGVDAVFLPEATTLYPDDYHVKVSEVGISEVAEGEYRPGHFNGMLTIVLKLFNIIQPTHAYFGEKDYQQLLLIKKMVEALFIPVDVVGCPTVREASGLAMSSRNSRLSETGKNTAALLSAVLKQKQPVANAVQALQQGGFQVDYVKDLWHRRLAAVWLEGVRLIDNVQLEA